MSDTKKDVCRALTNVVRKSPLVDRIDPKSFYAMLNTNFNVLYHEGTLDLVPVWEALAPAEVPPPLYGLFLAFEGAAAQSGFSVRLPPVVEGLSAEQRTNYVALVRGSNGQAPPSVVEITDDEFYQTDPNAPAIPLSLGTGDLKPFVPDDLRREVVQLVVQSLKTAPVGQKLDSAQLAYLVDSNFEDLCDGQTFDFAPILGGLRQLDGVKDADVYAGVVALEIALGERDIALQPIHMDVDRELAARLVMEAEAEARRRAEEAAAEVRARGHSKEAPPPPPVQSQPLKVPRGEEAREQRLRSWGLRMLTGRQLKVLRYAVLAVGLLSVVGLAWALRLDKDIGAGTFEGHFPMKEAGLQQGVFQGVVDDSKWWDLSLPDREKKIEALQKVMFDNGWIPQAQIRDTKGRLVVVGMGGGKLSVAAFFRFGKEDGTIPEDARRPAANAPPEGHKAKPPGNDKPAPK